MGQRECLLGPVQTFNGLIANNSVGLQPCGSVGHQAAAYA
jgi:hypothetical protein